jgi:hypothetical protein
VSDERDAPDAFLSALLHTLAESLDVREIFARISEESRRIVRHDFLLLGLLSEDHLRVLGRDWFVPYHVDAGAGDARFTWQAFAGVGYHFAWGDAMIGYRHLAYEFKSAQPVSDLAFSGPLAGVALRF